MTDDGLAHIKDLNKLVVLELGINITDAGLKHITSLTHLRQLAHVS